MNRGSEAMALDWLKTASLLELNAAARVMEARKQELRDKAAQPQENEAGPVTYGDFDFVGAARAFYRSDFPDAHETDIVAPPDSIVGFPLDTFQKNVRAAKPALVGFDVVNVGGMG